MTEANLIVHHLLGDELATRLEHLVQFTASHLLEREYVWERVKSLRGNDPSPVAPFTSNVMTGSPQQVRLRLSA